MNYPYQTPVRICTGVGPDCQAPAGFYLHGLGWLEGCVSAKGTCVICEQSVCQSCSTELPVGRVCRFCWTNGEGEG